MAMWEREGQAEAGTDMAGGTNPKEHGHARVENYALRIPLQREQLSGSSSTGNVQLEQM